MDELTLEDTLQLYAQGGLAAFAPLFERYGSGHFVSRHTPTEEMVESRELQDLLRWYTDLAPAGEPPVWTPDIPFDLKTILANLHVLEPTDGGGRMRYRIYASSVAKYYGADRTGKLLEETGTLHVVFHAIALSVAAQRTVLYTQHSPPDNSRVNDCQRLYLPFVNAAGDLHRILVGWYPFRRQEEDPTLPEKLWSPERLAMR